MADIKCPLCERKLQKKYEGLICPNWKCNLGNFKCTRGWIYLDRKKEDSKLFFTSKYDFDITRHENIKNWLKLKSKLLYEKGKCEICGLDHHLHVHHILLRSSNPELVMDEENLMVLCKDCHKKIHNKDKYKFS